MKNYCTNFRRNRSKTVGGVCNTKLLELDRKKWLCSRGNNSKTGGADTSKSCFAKLLYFTNIHTNLKKNCNKTVGEIDDTK